MEVSNHLIPNKDQMDGFLEGDIDSPIAMVNLLKFKEKAKYEDGRHTELSRQFSMSSILILSFFFKLE